MARPHGAVERIVHSRRVLAALRYLRGAWLWLLSVAAVFLAWVALHLPVTDATDWFVQRVGFDRYDETMRALAALMAIATVLALWRRERGPLSRRPALVGSLVLLALALISLKWLTIAPVEFVHFPQYGIVGYLLARAISAEPAWLGATALGALDETNQFLFLRRGRPEYFDWNDVCLNALGAALGVGLAIAARPLGARLSLSARLIAIVFVGTTMTAAAIDPPVLAPYLTPTPRGASWRVLSAGEGLAFATGIWLVTRWMIAAVRQSQTTSICAR